MSTLPHSTIIRRAIERIVGQTVRPGMPGRIESYDATKQLASVQPLILNGEIDPSSGDRLVERFPIINDVPVVFGGTARCRFTYDLIPGDTVWLAMSSHSLDLWLQQGGEVDPQDDRRFHLSDAVAFPGLFDFTSVPSDASTSGGVLHGSSLKLGGPDANDPVARKSDIASVVSAINSLKTAVDGHSHPVSTTGTATAQTGATTGIVWTPPTATTPACSPVVSSK